MRSTFLGVLLCFLVGVLLFALIFFFAHLAYGSDRQLSDSLPATCRRWLFIRDEVRVPVWILPRVEQPAFRPIPQGNDSENLYPIAVDNRKAVVCHSYRFAAGIECGFFSGTGVRA